jgi:hypothetical protein
MVLVPKTDFIFPNHGTKKQGTLQNFIKRNPSGSKHKALRKANFKNNELLSKV